MKKFISFFLAFVLCAVTLCTTASADAATDEFGSYLQEKFENYDPEIDISSFVSKYGWSTRQTLDMVAAAYYSHPEFFFVKNGFEYSVINDKVRSLRFDYVVPQSDLTAARNRFSAAAKKAVASITDGMSDIDKALYVHDYLIANCRYDTAKKNYSAYNCLIDRSCVCQGYTLAYEYILNELLGIECTAVYSDATNHIWNYVKIGKSWYHVDLTLDDALDSYKGVSYDRLGKVLHDNFLMSDTACKKTSALHKNWIVAGGYPAATDTSYDSAFWKGISSRICYNKGTYYYTANGGTQDGKRIVNVCAYDTAAKKNSVIVKIKSRWYVSRKSDGSSVTYGTSAYVDVFSSIEYINGKLWFNSNKAVYSFDPQTKKYKKVYTLNKGENMQIFGMAETDGKLRVAYRRDLTYAESYLKLVFSQ